jgi:hypothetical protein
MAWNPSPKIADLRDLAGKWKADQMIVLAIHADNGTFEVVSYGRTRELCDRARLVNDRICQMVSDGTIEIDP